MSTVSWSAPGIFPQGTVEKSDMVAARQGELGASCADDASAADKEEIHGKGGIDQFA